MIRYIDLFAGIGGMRPALGPHTECVLTCELDKFACQTYLANYPVNHLFHIDINTLDSNKVPDHDLLLAGFPCQPFSAAGVSKKRSLGRPDGFMDQTQGTLFFELARILEAKRPRAFLLENVKNLTSHDKGATFRTIRAVLEGLGYTLHIALYDACFWVPQHRERIYIVGFYNPTPFDFKAIELPKLSPTLESILLPDDMVNSKYTLSDKLWGYLQAYAKKHQARGNGFGYGLASKHGQTRTLSARYGKDGSEILIPQEGKNPRRLTPRECARLMGFPDNFVIPVSDAQAYKQFGNSVVVPVVQTILNLVLDSL